MTIARLNTRAIAVWHACRAKGAAVPVTTNVRLFGFVPCVSLMIMGRSGSSARTFCSIVTVHLLKRCLQAALWSAHVF